MHTFPHFTTLCFLFRFPCPLQFRRRWGDTLIWFSLVPVSDFNSISGFLINDQLTTLESSVQEQVKKQVKGRWECGKEIACENSINKCHWPKALQSCCLPACLPLIPSSGSTWTFLVHLISLSLPLSGTIGSCSDYYYENDWDRVHFCNTLKWSHFVCRSRNYKHQGGGGRNGNPQLINTLPLSLEDEDDHWMGGHLGDLWVD